MFCLNKEKNPISKHIFLFPFTWDVKKKENLCDSSFDERVNIEIIQEKLLNSDWEMKTIQAVDEEEHCNFYAEYQYFYDNVRKAIYTYENDDKQIVYNYEYKNNDIKKDSWKYEIECWTENKEKYINKKYILDIGKIELKIYQTGIGILSFHLNNFDKNTKKEDILRINEYGRRIYPAFLPVENIKKKVLARNISITYKKNKVKTVSVAKENFRENKYNKINKLQISATIMVLLGKYFKSNERDLKEDEIAIKPIIDDRMYVLSWYGNDLKSNEACEDTQLYYKDEFWYKYVFIDGGFPTCQNKDMFEGLLKEHTYLRWQNYGTLYGVSRYSFVSLTNSYEKLIENDADYIVTHMESMYYQVACLSLAQRASILRFSNEASLIALKTDENNVSDKVRNLYKKYLEFINCIYFREVTAQEQGIELYKMMHKIMEIDRDINSLKEEISELHQYTILIDQNEKLKEEKETNRKINILTIIGALTIIPTYLTGFFGMNIYDSDELLFWWSNTRGWLWLNAYLLFPTICTIILFEGSLPMGTSIGRICYGFSMKFKRMGTIYKVMFLISLIILLIHVVLHIF